MYRQIARTTIARQATRAPFTRTFRLNASSSSTSSSAGVNSKFLVGSIIPLAMAIGYYTAGSRLVENESVAEAIRNDFKEGDAAADVQQQLFSDEQTRLQKQKSKEEIAKIEDKKKQNTKEASGTDSRDIAVDSDIREKASKELDTDNTRHANSDPRQVEARAVKKEEIRSDKQSSDESKQEAAYNPDTGEINWDCPCLGGMAHGTCGEEFKQAFSCFVFSETEPKGIDCIKKFENMRSCFKQHPDEYKEELFQDDHELDNEAVEHVVLETAEPAVQQIEGAVEEGKLKPKQK
ncbi:uncharacterized protein LODBEIA_P29020 [Lodderomyces beijingensis]|uniref:Mitochondrial intermembrane space import and assembly protein 40 n=1 Tax=Lodderomyces beijingensis TaxID=1775926 RepID=A0ABP0ZKJ8_9ASCO